MAELQLDTLESKGLIRVATIEPELEYLFRHALVQDAAYESLLKQERRALHRLVGDVLEELYPERHGELAAVLGRHFEQAGDGAKAIEYLTAAAHFAYERNAIVEAYELFGRAAALLPPLDEEDDEPLQRRRIEIELGRAKAGFTFLSEDQSLAILAPLVAPAERLGDLRLAVDVHLAIAFVLQLRGGRPESDPLLLSSLDRVSEIARELDDPLIAALPQSIIGLLQVFTGRLREGVAALSEAAPLLEQKHDFIGSSFALVALAIGLARLGDIEAAEAAADRARDLGERGDLISRLDSMIGDSTVRSIKGDLAGALPIAMQCTALAEEAGATGCVVASNLVVGDAQMRLGDFGAARIAFERGDEVANAIRLPTFRPSIAAYLRSSSAALGDSGPNTRTFDEALEEAREIDDEWGVAHVIWKRADTAGKLAEGDKEQMLADYEAAAAAFAEMGARPFHARVQRDWGNALHALGRTKEGDAKLRAALAILRDLGIEREADELEKVLAGP